MTDPTHPLRPSALALASSLILSLLAFWLLHRYGLPWDEAWQRWFYQPEAHDVQQGVWVWDEHQKRTSFWAHDVPRYAFQLFGLMAAFLAWRQPQSRRGWLALLLALILVPSAVSGLKHVTRHYCPDHQERFGGPVKTDGTLNLTNIDGRAPQPECFPAGHPAPGFALIALIFVARSRRGRIGAVALALGCGFGLTFVQMARGEHFFSHGVASLAVAIMLVPLCGEMARWILHCLKKRSRNANLAEMHVA